MQVVTMCLRESRTGHRNPWSTIIFYGLLCVHELLADPDNYPSRPNIVKPCVKQKPIMEFEGPICIPTQDGFEARSVENCEIQLKKECPEFNRANCEWFSYSWDSTQTGFQCNFQEVQFPTCKLKYKAVTSSVTAKTWMEIFYVNQYGTSLTNRSIFSVVELHRNRFYGFDNTEQPQWPLSVSNAQSVLGVTWKIVDDFQKYISNMDTGDLANIKPNLCEDAKDVGSMCAENVRNLVSAYAVKDGNYNDRDFVTNCVWTLLDTNGAKQTVCQVAIKAMDGEYTYSKHVYQVQYRQNGKNKLWVRSYTKSVR